MGTVKGAPRQRQLLLTGQGDMFNAESSAVEPGMQEVWAIYQRLDEKERALLLEVARAFAGAQ